RLKRPTRSANYISTGTGDVTHNPFRGMGNSSEKQEGNRDNEATGSHLNWPESPSQSPKCQVISASGWQANSELVDYVIGIALSAIHRQWLPCRFTASPRKQRPPA